ncbi:helix-turn-helix transcriptional regulator [Desulfobulbus oligotrophicus]|jgi:DNA-binding NarL/FixJ family response regulator|nr:response regulator transcription factor [Desulfobulbus oligotrophicus]MDY0391547.1 response regulator transcription factor [Desulfobulbus oligotrophicus]
MNLILCCSNPRLRERWFTALNRMFSTYQATTLEDLRIFVQQQITFGLLLIHRPLIDFAAVTYIKRRQPNCKLVILSDRPSETEGLALLRLGVIGYANSYTNPQRLQDAIRSIVDGSVWISQDLMYRLITQSAPSVSSTFQTQAIRTPQLNNLSDRELQIADLVSQGLSNGEIAVQLGITERTVKAHLGAVYAKTSTKGRLALALLMRQAASASNNG